MGTSTNGILAYGYDLGEDWGGVNEYDRPEPDWYDDAKGWEESASHALMKAAGVETHSHWISDDELLKATGVCFDTYCSDRYPMRLLVAKTQTCYRGDADPIDLTLPDNADERLAWALGVLGITPKADKPQWLLASYWG